MWNFLNRQLRGNDEQLATLAKDLEIARGWKKKAEIIKEVTAGIQNE
jgi:hypothetical protein